MSLSMSVKAFAGVNKSKIDSAEKKAKGQIENLKHVQNIDPLDAPPIAEAIVTLFETALDGVKNALANPNNDLRKLSQFLNEDLEKYLKAIGDPNINMDNDTKKRHEECLKKAKELQKKIDVKHKTNTLNAFEKYLGNIEKASLNDKTDLRELGHDLTQDYKIFSYEMGNNPEDNLDNNQKEKYKKLTSKAKELLNKIIEAGKGKINMNQAEAEKNFNSDVQGQLKQAQQYAGAGRYELARNTYNIIYNLSKEAMTQSTASEMLAFEAMKHLQKDRIDLAVDLLKMAHNLADEGDNEKIAKSTKKLIKDITGKDHKSEKQVKKSIKKNESKVKEILASESIKLDDFKIAIREYVIDGLRNGFTKDFKLNFPNGKIITLLKARDMEHNKKIVTKNYRMFHQDRLIINSLGEVYSLLVNKIN